MLYSIGETLQERGAGNQILTKVVSPGTHLIKVPTRCIVDSDKGWSYQAFHVAKKIMMY